jgi:hypothetical protein
MQTRVVGFFLLIPIFFIWKLMMIISLFAKHFCKHRRKKILLVLAYDDDYLFNNNVLLKFIYG